MANTTILLREDIENLGGRGEIIKVKAGFARNFLLPQGKASLATKGNVKQIELERSSLLKKSAQEKSTADAQAEQMKGLELVFLRKAGETGTLFGSVTTMDIAEALQSKGYEIDRRRIVMKEAIKEIGDYTAQVKLHREVMIDIPVSVTAEGGGVVNAGDAKASKAENAADQPEVADENSPVDSKS